MKNYAKILELKTKLGTVLEIEIELIKKRLAIQAEIKELEKNE